MQYSYNYKSFSYLLIVKSCYYFFEIQMELNISYSIPWAFNSESNSFISLKDILNSSKIDDRWNSKSNLFA